MRHQPTDLLLQQRLISSGIVGQPLQVAEDVLGEFDGILPHRRYILQRSSGARHWAFHVTQDPRSAPGLSRFTTSQGCLWRVERHHVKAVLRLVLVGCR